MNWSDLATSLGLRLSLPLLFATWGALVSSRVRLFNVSVEGAMVSGTFVYSAVWLFTYSTFKTTDPSLYFTLGFLATSAVGCVLGYSFGVGTVKFELDPIVTGIALNMLVFGLLEVLNKWVLETMAAGRGGIGMAIGGLIEDNTRILAPVAVVGTLGLYVLYRATKFGEMAMALIEPEGERAGDDVGLPTKRIKMISCCLSGIFASWAGMALVLMAGTYSRNMSAGRGFIALALSLVAGGDLRWILLVILVYGLGQSSTTSGLIAQKIGLSSIPPQIETALPYLAVLLLLILTGTHQKFLKRSVRAADVWNK